MDILSIVLSNLLATVISSDSPTNKNQITPEAFVFAHKNEQEDRTSIVQSDRKANEIFKLTNAEVTAYNYHKKIGIPQAEQILNYESELEIVPIISSGRESRLGEIPYQGGLVISLYGEQINSVCGCSLISKNRALTAAHCWWDGYDQATSFVVVLGSTRLFSGGTRITTSRVALHPNWNVQTLMNDIAVIQIRPVTFNANIQPIALPSPKDSSNDWSSQTGVVSGYGYSDKGTTGFLYNANVKIITNAECHKVFDLTNTEIYSSHICAGDSNSNASPGDSGSPLAIFNDNTTIIVGVVSFGLINETTGHACRHGTPVAYTRITSYMEWIQSLM